MKQLKNIKAYRHLKLFIAFLFLFGLSIRNIKAQDTAAASTTLNMSYYLPANNVPYLQVNTKKKVGRKFEPVTGVPINIYFKEAEPKNLLGKVITDQEGLGRIGFPPSFSDTWDSLDEFKFVANSDLPAGQEPLSTDITIKKAKLTIDTDLVDGVRMVKGELKEKNGNNWLPVKNIDMQLSIKRMLGNLSVSDGETYTSDSAGISSAEFKRNSIPGDQNGNITLVAEVDDNDTYGNLATEKTVGWGKVVVPATNFFDQRTLWSIRTRTPIWLLFVVYSIVAGVWGTMIYLLFRLIKIKKLGNLTPSE